MAVKYEGNVKKKMDKSFYLYLLNTINDVAVDRSNYTHLGLFLYYLAIKQEIPIYWHFNEAHRLLSR